MEGGEGGCTLRLRQVDVDLLTEAEEFGGGSCLGGNIEDPVALLVLESSIDNPPGAKIPEGSGVGARTRVVCMGVGT